MIYSILSIDKLNEVRYDEVYQDSSETVRVNVSGNQFIISFPSDAVPSIAKDEYKYTHTGILKFLTDPSNGWVTEE